MNQKDWDKFYAKNKGNFRSPSLKVIAPFIKDKWVADLGCGDGVFTKKLSKIAREIIGVDYSLVAIENAKKRCPRNVYFAVRNLEESFFFSPADVFICKNVFAFIKNKKRFINSILASKPKLLILMTPEAVKTSSKHWKSISCNPKPYLKKFSRVEVFNVTHEKNGKVVTYLCYP